jgi:hypothetical protein
MIAASPGFRRQNSSMQGILYSVFALQKPQSEIREELSYCQVVRSGGAVELLFVQSFSDN